MNNFGGESGTTTTHTTITETHVQTNIRWDPAYIKSIPGGLKLGAVVLDIVVFICVMSSGSYYRETPTAEWTDFVTMTAFWVSGILLILYLLHVIEKFHVIPWMMIEMIFCCLWSFFFFTAALDLAIKAPRVDAFGAASFFGFAAMILYGFDGYLKFKGWRAGQLAQGDRTVQQSESNTQATY